MIERKYSVSEIDSMRSSVKMLNSTRRSDRLSSGAPVSWFVPGDASLIEDRLRTYMLAGIEPQELADAAHEHVRNSYKEQRQMEAQ